MAADFLLGGGTPWKKTSQKSTITTYLFASHHDPRTWNRYRSKSSEKQPEKSKRRFKRFWSWWSGCLPMFGGYWKPNKNWLMFCWLERISKKRSTNKTGDKLDISHLHPCIVDLLLILKLQLKLNLFAICITRWAPTSLPHFFLCFSLKMWLFVTTWTCEGCVVLNFDVWT